MSIALFACNSKPTVIIVNAPAAVDEDTVIHKGDSVAMFFTYFHNGDTVEITTDQLAILDSSWRFISRKDKIYHRHL